VIRLAVRVRREHAELVLAELLELAPSGVEEVELGDGLVEYAVYGAAGELPDLPDLKAAAGTALVEIATSELPDDWSERWKQFHRPVLIDRDEPLESSRLADRSNCGVVPALHVRPPWESPSDRPDAIEVVIDPAQAFGTGSHATTRMCLELMLELAACERRRGALLDVGTGSGVLAIAAARLGFAPVLGVDHDQESVVAARKNATVNEVEVEVRRLDLRSETLPRLEDVGGAVLTANLLRPLLLDLADCMSQAPRHLLASGLLVNEVDEVAHAFRERLGLCERGRLRSGEWAAVWLSGSATDSSSGG
jgi:ribosomal protein L11 methyltransferase